jgi:hypothetical protein
MWELSRHNLVKKGNLVERKKDEIDKNLSQLDSLPNPNLKSNQVGVALK